MDNSRRDFLKKASAGVALFTILPRHVLGAMGNKRYVAPSDQLTKGIIGVGGIGTSGYHFSSNKHCRLISICDVDTKHLDRAARLGKDKLGINLKKFRDFRELIHDQDLDIVHIATPPHWHAIMAIEAANAGKDIFCETPMTRTIGESKRVKEAIEHNRNIFRLNTWYRYSDTFFGFGTKVEPLKKLVNSGLLGWPLTVRISNSTGFPWRFNWIGKENLVTEKVPESLDYDMWLGPAPFKPYNTHRVHSTFRCYWDYDSGALGDMGQHYIDPVQYILGKDKTFPIKVEVDAPQQHPDAVGMWRKITYTYADDCKIILEGEGYESKGKLPYIEGPKGKIYQGLESTLPNVMDIIAELSDPESRNTDFLECIKTRQKFALDESIGHHSCTIVNMGGCALRLGRTLYFDPKKELFLNDDEANKLIDQPMRGTWSLI